MDPKNPKGTSGSRNKKRSSDETALMEEIRQLRAALRIYRELVKRLMRERAGE
jgi:hypothetical protein